MVSFLTGFYRATIGVWRRLLQWFFRNRRRETPPTMVLSQSASGDASYKFAGRDVGILGLFGFDG
jgi:hypothetical protein